ncbi:T9SS C-terminal target domain-containing protein [Candidatus Marinimicrobia bacterium PRS2]|nr:T9SS C-terminal target domain-containing protein [Candidatus Marinimicrobia bacterium PRS2]
MIFRFLLFISLGFGANYFQSNSPSSYAGVNIPDTLRLVGIMAQFPLEVPDNPKTSGNGNFLNLNHEEYNHFYDSTTPRCNGFIVDRPPHNSAYFQKQLEAVGNYYKEVSDYNLAITKDMVLNSNSPENGYYTVSNTMEYYAKADTSLALFFSEVLDSAKYDIELILTETNDVVFIVFHAGLGQDFSLPGLDPTIYDLKSAYIDEKMMNGITPTEILGESIQTGILLPETQNMIYFDVVEDIFGNPDYGTEDLCGIQLGLTGIFAFLLGYELGLPPLFNPETGDPGVGFFGLMDHGSNNGRGVIPAPPSPWTRSLPAEEWSTIETISPFQSTDTTFFIIALDSLNTLLRINISDDEYFLIENRNNWVTYKTDIDSLRRKNKIDEYRVGHWFDTVTNEFTESQIQIDDATQVITGFDHYDYGLPGSGILIWHITNPHFDLSPNQVINDDSYNHVKIEEADGSQDIGTKSYAFFASDSPTTGTRWDFWYHGNEGYEFANPDLENETIFDYWSSPNSRTVDGSDSFLSIEIISGISDTMQIQITFNNGVEIINLADTTIQYLGNGYNKLNSTAVVYYEKDGKIYSHSHLDDATPLEDITIGENQSIYTFNDTFYIAQDQNYWIDTMGIHHTEYKAPMGYIHEYNVADTIDFSLNYLGSSLVFGDIDQDGLDEIITIEDGDIVARNGNGTLVDGFPIKGDFSGIPLIVNIINVEEDEPELICREGENITILSNKGDRLRQLSSFASKQPLALVPFWSGKMALIDGSRLFLFDLDMDHSYWLNPHSRPSGFPLSTGTHFKPEDREYIRRKAYNYPNPITEGTTTFRFYVSNSTTSEVRVKIYNAAGYLVVDDLINNDITHNEFNEIKWDASQFDAGLYLAEIKPNGGESELVRLVVIK